MGQQLVRQQHGLCGLEVGLTRHDCVRVAIRLAQQSLHHVHDTSGHVSQGFTQPHSEQRGHLVIAGTPSTQASTHFSSDSLNQPTLHGSMDVLIGSIGPEGSAAYIITKFLETGDHGFQVGVGQKAGAVEHAGVCLRGQHVIRRQHPVEVRGLTEGCHRLRGPAGKTAAPEGTLVGSMNVLLSHLLPFESPCWRKVVRPDRAWRRSWRTDRAAPRNRGTGSGRRNRPRRRWPG